MEKNSAQDGMAMILDSENGDVPGIAGVSVGIQEIICENEENYFEGISETETSELDLDMEEKEEEEEEEDELQKAIESILELEEIREQEDPNGATGKESSYKCDICRKNVSVKMLERHMNNHKKREQRGELKCKFCGRRFVKRHVMYRHEMSHRQNIYLCQECGRPFYRKDVYEVHVRTHTGEKPHQCPICKNRYNDPSNLRKHMYCHETHKNYNCELCDEVFNTYGTWKKHHRLHAGLENFKCSVCSKVFFRWEKLKDHEISVHNIATRERQSDKRKNPPRVRKPKQSKSETEKQIESKKEKEKPKVTNSRPSRNKTNAKNSSRDKPRTRNRKSPGKDERETKKTSTVRENPPGANTENSSGTDKENKDDDLVCISIPSPPDNCPTIDLEQMEIDVTEEEIMEPLSPIHVGPFENIEIEDVTDGNEVLFPMSPIPISAIPFTCPICGEEFESQDNWETHLIFAHGDKMNNPLHETLAPLVEESFTCWICGVEIRIDSDSSAAPSSATPKFPAVDFQGGLRECPKCKSAKTSKKLSQLSSSL